MLVIKSNWMCALGTEFGSRRKEATAIGTAAVERSGTLLTEFRFRPIVVFAPGALHLNRSAKRLVRDATSYFARSHTTTGKRDRSRIWAICDWSKRVPG